MAEIPVSILDKDWLKGRFSGAEVHCESPFRISGILDFDMLYNHQKNLRII